MIEEPKQVNGYSASDRLAVVLACLAGVMAIILFLVEKTPFTVVSLLVLMVALSVYPILHLVRRTNFRITVLAFMIIGTLVFGWYVWPRSKLPIDQAKSSIQSAAPPASQTAEQSPSQSSSPAPTQPLPAKPKLVHRPRASHAIIQQSSTGDCSPNMIGSGNTNNCNQPPRVIASVQTQTKTGDSEAPWEVRFTISATGLVQTGNLRLKCSGPVVRAGISRINPAELITGSNGPDANDPHTVVYELGAATLSPKQTVTIVVYSKEPITVLAGTIGHEQIIF